MIRTRFIIPLFFGLVALVLAGVGAALRSSTTVKRGASSFTPGESRVFEGLKLIEGRHYKLMLGASSRIPLGRTAVVGISLLDDDENEIFSIEDAYWHERGTWREGGESGSWEESNSLTEFDFKPPITGDYDLQLDLYQTNVGGMKLSFRLKESQPFVLAEWPMLMAAFVLLALALWVFFSRNTFMAKVLRSLGVGTKLTVNGKAYEVTRVFHYRGGGDVGIELELTGPDGARRFLSIEEFERDWTDAEDEYHTAIHHQTLLDNPLSDDEVEDLENQNTSNNRVFFRGQTYMLDTNNSGSGVRDDMTSGGRTRYSSQMYRSEVFPRKTGNHWLERITFDGKHPEWSVMTILGANDIKLDEPIPFKKLDPELQDSQVDT